uniref:Secreted protein n=1 Tax=Brachymyrmex patagonicus TaxID=604570 RepID=F1AG58_9HYME|nr:hypothetical protein [Brachymyrmex patagonicus]
MFYLSSLRLLRRTLVLVLSSLFFRYPRASTFDIRYNPSLPSSNLFFPPFEFVPRRLLARLTVVVAHNRPNCSLFSFLFCTFSFLLCDYMS